MASPDLTPYVDLTFFDKDPQDVFDAALLDLQTKLPGWTPREGNIEVLLLEAMALQVAEAIFTANRLPGAVVAALLRMYGVDPDFGTLPKTTIKFYLSDTLGHDIPAGTGVRLDLPGGLPSVVFTTDAAATAAPGSSSVTVAATGDRYTADANGVASGTGVAMIDAITFVDRAETASVVTDGDDPESDDEWLERGVQRFARLSETLVLPRHFESAALENPLVVKAKALDLWDGFGGAPGDDPGHVTVAVYGDGAALSSGAKADLLAALEAAALAQLTVHVIDPTITTVDVTVSVKVLPGYVSASVQTAVAAAVNAYLDPVAWDWSGTVRRNELIALISNVEGVDYVGTLTLPAADVTLTGTATLADAGTVTVTVI